MFRILPLLLLLLLSAPHPARAETITLAADLWCPYNCEPDAAQPGFMVDVARAVFEPRGHVVQYRVLPWKRAIREAEKGNISGVIGATRSDAPGLVFPDCDMVDYLATFYVRRGTPWRYTGLPSLAGKRLGVVAGYSYGPDIDGLVQAKNGLVHESVGDDACMVNLRHLSAGRLDVALEDVNVVGHLRGQSDSFQDLQPAGALPARDMSIAFSPKLPRSGEYAALLCQGLRELRASGRLDALRARYGMGPEKAAGSPPAPAERP